jgi:crossover junction endodeoxyribonuclease RuvC
MIYIGIDPGLTGAVGVLYEGVTAVHDIPTIAAGKGVVKREIDAHSLARLIAGLGPLDQQRAILERTSAMPGQGVASMFSMGVSRGVILGVLGTLGIVYEEVVPVAWKRAYGLIGAEKDMGRRFAMQRFPSAAWQLDRIKDHNRAEALLLADYLRSKSQ